VNGAKGAARLLWPFLRRHRPVVGAGLCATVLVTLAELAAPWPLKLVIDRLLDGDRGVPFTLEATDLRFLVVVAGLVLLIAAVDAGASYGLDVGLGRAGERIAHDLRGATYAHLQRLSLAFHERRETGDLVTRVTGDVNAVGALVTDSAGALVSAALLLVGMVTVSVMLDPVVTGGMLLVVPPLALLTHRYRGKIRRAARRQRACEGNIASLSTQSLSAIRVVKAFGSEPHEVARIDEESEGRRRAGLEAVRIQSRFGGLVDVVGAVGTAVVLVVGTFRVAAGALTPGDLVVLVAYARRVYRPLRDIARQTARISKAMARADRVAELLTADEFLEELPDARDGVRLRGELELEGVAFAYDADRPVLEELSLHIPPGDRVALMGPSGAGKSTIAALLARFYDPTSGLVLIDGHDARSWSLSWLRSNVGLVLQDSLLFTGTVEENIAYATRSSREDVVAAAKAAGIHGFITTLPQGYDTPLGPQATSLSGGQRQRLAIARTLLRDPAILILDEPTLGLDADSEAHVLESLEALMRGRTTILITHSIALARRADRVVLLEGGAIQEEGTPEELLGKPGRFRHLARVQGLAPTSAPPVPRNPGLPHMGRLLDAEGMVPALQRSLGRGVQAGVTAATVHYLRFKPRTNLVVHYEVQVDGARQDAVAMIAASADLGGRARKDAYRALARRVNGRSPAEWPLTYDPDLDALIQWLPLDVWLPALAEPPAALAERLQRAGVEVPAQEPVRLAYKPRRRATLRLGDHVLKAYRAEADLEAATRGLQVAGRLASMPRLEAVCPELRLTVQPWLAGRPSSLAQALDAGRSLAELHELTVDLVLPVHTPSDQLQAVGASVAMASSILPDASERLERLVARLEDRMPTDLPSVVSHGDFHPGQILCQGTVTSLVDFDECCLAPPALDLGNYAAHAVGGTEDVGSAHEVLERLTEGYGAQPAALNWYLATAVLRRVWFPFRRAHERWPERIHELAAAAEALAP
jgi:ATP-binding cassette, subfamily B, bacterial